MRMEEFASLGGKARASKLSPEQRKEIARKGAEAIRGKKREKRGPYKKKRKIFNKKQKLRELLVVLHDHFAAGWKVYPQTTLSNEGETVSQRVAELLRSYKKGRHK